MCVQPIQHLRGKSGLIAAISAHFGRAGSGEQPNADNCHLSKLLEFVGLPPKPRPDPLVGSMFLNIVISITAECVSVWIQVSNLSLSRYASDGVVSARGDQRPEL